MRIDLHIHSTASDGSLTPGAVATTARAAGLDIIAITDHDTVAGVAQATIAAHGFVHVIPAIELSTWGAVGAAAAAEFHVLGYFIDPDNTALRAYGERAATSRESRMHLMLERLGTLGVRVAWEDVLAAAGTRPESIGRPHLARALVQRGHVASVSEAFDRYIGNEGPAFVPTALITPFDAIDIIHAAGGVAVWAHPRPDQLANALAPLVAYGLDGVECYRPRLSHADIEYVAAAAASSGIFVTGGSDWHGEWQGRLGDFHVERDDVSAFLESGGI